MTAIDIGSPAIDRTGTSDAGYTIIDKNNPANADGKITSVEIWAATNMSGVEVGTFYIVSGANFTCRDYEAIGSVTAGSKQTFTVDLDVITGDYIGIYHTGGTLELQNTGSDGRWYYLGDAIPCTNTTFTAQAGWQVSLYGTGSDAPTTYELTLTDGISIGDTRTESMVAEVSRTDGLKGGDSTNEASVMDLLKTDGFKIGDRQKWPGLGMCIFPSEDSYIDTVLANGFSQLRHMVLQNQDITDSKAKVLSWMAKGAKCIWGVSANSPLTAANWSTFQADVLSAAAWAQSNGLFEFQIGNELEYIIDGTTLTAAQLIVNLKALATLVQAVYTIGNVSYSFGHDQTLQEAWNVAGRGDIDLFGLNSYVGTDWDWWKSKVDWAASRTDNFGTHCYFSELNLNIASLNNYSTNEAVQAAGVTTMLDYVISKGFSRAFYFTWKDATSILGVVAADGHYRQLWGSLIGNDVTMTASPAITDGIKVGDSGTITALMELLKTDGIKIGDSLTEYIIAELTKIDGVKLGDSTSESMVAYPAITDGIKLSDTSTLDFLTALLSLTDGFKVGDSAIESTTAELARTDGFTLGDTAIITMLAELLKTDGFKISDLPEFALMRVIALAIKLLNRSLAVKLNKRDITLKMRVL